MLVPSFAAEFRDATKIYHVGLLGRSRRTAVTGINLKIGLGECVGLLGPNRAGKTTLVKMLLSLARPTSGEVLRLGEPISNRATLARVGYVHENQAYPNYLTAAALLEYYGALSLVPHETVRSRIAPLLERVGLADRAKDEIRTFSKGMVQRLGIAQALLNEPDLLILDEPTEGLDLGGRGLLVDVIREWKRKGRTVIVVTHVVREIETLLDRVAVLTAGRLTYDGKLGELIGSSESRKPLENALQELYVGTAPARVPALI
jgi:ABC-2 type transport system ATP-binding protein